MSVWLIICIFSGITTLILLMLCKLLSIRARKMQEQKLKLPKPEPVLNQEDRELLDWLEALPRPMTRIRRERRLKEQ